MSFPGRQQGNAPLAPRNNLQEMRSRLNTGPVALDAPPAKPAFQLARPSAPSRIDLGSSRQAPKAPVSAPAAVRTPTAPAPTQFSRPVAEPLAGGGNTSGVVPFPAAYNPKLDQLPLDRLRAMLLSNQDEKIALLEKDADEDDFLADDPEMVQGKIKLLTRRIAELKAAIAARAPTSSGRSRGGTPTQPPHSYPTPMSVSHAHTPAPQLPSSSSSRTTQGFTDSQPEAGPSRPRPRTLVPDSSPPPPQLDEMIAMAEEEEDFDDSVQEIPPQTPPKSRAKENPQRLARTNSGVVADHAAALAEFDDIDVLMLDSSPPTNPNTRPPRTEASHSRDIPEPWDLSSPQRMGPMPSQSAPQPRQPKVVKVDTTYPWSKEVEQKLRQVFKLDSFRTHQREAVNETMAGKDVFVLMPTGGGKSLTYQLPAVCSTGKTKGVTFVVSPLISLINDQTRHLIKRNVPAIAYTGDLTASDKNMAHEELSRPEPYTKVVYVTPEMLTMGGRIKGIIRDLIRRNRLARFVIDEAHCVSGWGHDFRSDYLKLDHLRRDYPGVPIMALTATAPIKVQEDIIRVLGIHGCSVLKQSFNRPNLHYEVRPKLKKVLSDIAAFIGTQRPGASGIIYCSSREKCETLAKELRDKHNVQAWHYHAGMSKGDRRKVQEGWQDHKFSVIVATIAFGMGIDKPDVRYVIHHSLPRSLEGYYQETGRAGRDGKDSTCILFYSYGDSKSVMQMIERDTNLDRNQKERQKDSLREVLRFCGNKTDCRRSQVLAFFNEKFDPAECRKGCDVCLGREQNTISIKDVTDDAKKVISMMRAFDRDDRITILNAVDCFRGTNGNSAKGFGQNPQFGCGKDWDRGEAERLVQNLLIERVLDEYYSANGAGWTNSYLKASSYLNGRKTLKMDFRQASPRKTKAASKKVTTEGGQARLVPLAQRQAPAAATSKAKPLAKKRSRQAVLEEEQEFGGSAEDEDYEPIEDDSDEDQAQRGSSAAANAKRPRLSLPIAAPRRSDSGTPVEQCLRELHKLRTKHGKGTVPLHDETLELIAALMPPNANALEKVEGITPAHIKAYGTKILGITTKYVSSHRTEEAPNAPPPKVLTTAKTRKAAGAGFSATAGRVGPGSSRSASGSGSFQVTNLDAYTYRADPKSNPTVKRVGSAATAAPSATTSSGSGSGSGSGRLALARTGPASGPRF